MILYHLCSTLLRCRRGLGVSLAIGTTVTWGDGVRLHHPEAVVALLEALAMWKGTMARAVVVTKTNKSQPIRLAPDSLPIDSGITNAHNRQGHRADGTSGKNEEG